MKNISYIALILLILSAIGCRPKPIPCLPKQCARVTGEYRKCTLNDGRIIDTLFMDTSSYETYSCDEIKFLQYADQQAYVNTVQLMLAEGSDTAGYYEQRGSWICIE